MGRKAKDANGKEGERVRWSIRGAITKRGVKRSEGKAGKGGNVA
jgi:hypothetical protein